MSYEQPGNWPQPPQQQPAQAQPPQYAEQYPQQYAAPVGPQPPAAKQRKGHKRWIIPTCTAVAGIILGSASAGGGQATTTAAAPTVTVTEQSGAQQQPANLSAKEAELSKREAAVSQRERKVQGAEKSQQKAQQAARAATFGDGTYIVGTDIQPGQYRSRTADDLCYWARLKSSDGGMGAIIANNLSNGGQQLVTIKRTDKAFETRDCGTWELVK